VIRRKDGFTLTELLVALALSGIVIAVIFQVLSAQRSVAVTSEQVSAMEQNLRGAADLMMREIRMAGFDPRRTAGAGIDIATSSRFQFKVDADGDGDFANSSPPPSNDPNEQISYALTNDADGDGVADSFPCALGRKVWNGGLQQVSENIEVLNFVYIGSGGAVLSAPVQAADILKIRSIEITMVARTEKPDKSFTNSTSFENQRGTIIFVAPGDGFRRRSLSITVQCRNMGL
jgi:type IV pilus assembly protein PilW